MLDILRKCPEKIVWSQRIRGLDENAAYIAKEYDVLWRKCLFELNELRHLRNSISQEVGKLVDAEKQKKIREAQKLAEMIKLKEEEVSEYEEKRNALLQSLPNIVHETVPYGENENGNVPVRYWGEPKVWSEHISTFTSQTDGNVKRRQLGFRPRSHTELIETLAGADIERASKVAGARFYYLFDEMVWLDYALQAYALNFLVRKGFTITEPPPMINQKAYSGVTSLADFQDAIYKIDKENLFLIATSEHAIAALHMNEVLARKDLPLKYAGTSPCFRKEAGSHGKDTKGIFRVHHFNKIEQFVFCTPEESWVWHENLIKNAEELCQGLELPYRVVNICSGELGAVAAKKYDIEVWMPAAGEYRELVSCSNCLDWQSARLNIKYGEEAGKPSEGYVYTLNSTAIATGRTITAILENFQQEDGTVQVPSVLRSYLQMLKGDPVDYIQPRRRG